MKSGAVFQYRGNAFQQTKTVDLTTSGVRIRYEGRKDTTIPFSEIAKVDLLIRTSPAHGVAFVCRLWRANALFPSLTMGSKSYRAFNDFEAKDTAYRAFVTQLHTAMMKANPRCRFEVTLPESALVASLLHRLHFLLPVLVVAFIGALLLVGNIPVAVAATIAAAIGCVAYIFWGLEKLGPWPYDPSAIPDAMLPRQGGEVFTA
jgi:hypothetical protein